MAKKPRRHTINLERGSDGSWHEAGAFVTDKGLEKTSPFLPRSPAELRTLQQLLNLRNPPEGVDVRPSLGSRLAVYEHPPVPGSIGKWMGKGTKTDPYHWVGVGEKVAGVTIGLLLAAWLLECIEVDISNWWSTSAFNVESDLTAIGDDVLGAVGIQHSGPAAAGRHVRKPATFFTWFFQNAMMQGADLDQAVFTVNGLSTGFTSVQGPISTGSPGGVGPPGGGGGTTNKGPQIGYMAQTQYTSLPPPGPNVLHRGPPVGSPPA